MQGKSCDILISGAGPAGLSAAAAFSAAGFSVVLVDPSRPITSRNTNDSDLRSTAFLQPAKKLFEEIDLWQALGPRAVPLKALRIVDTTGNPPAIRAERAFQADEMGEQPFGWNIMNWQFRSDVLRHLETQQKVEMRLGVGVRTVLARTSGAIVTLSDNTRFTARLLVAADGRNSIVRQAVGIGTRITRYGQKSLAFTATHSRPHENTSTEIYHEGGPFTMVPLGDVGGKPASAIVWMNSARRSKDLLGMPEDAFNAAMTTRAAGLFGPMQLASRRGIFPIVTQIADKLTAERTALVAEAAHVLPPIGAQGLNTSLNDVAALVRVARSDPDRLGEPEMLNAYERARRTDIATRARVIDLFNRITRSGNIGLQSLRIAGLKAVHDLPPLRHALMRAGMGPRQAP